MGTPGHRCGSRISKNLSQWHRIVARIVSSICANVTSPVARSSHTNCLRSTKGIPNCEYNLWAVTIERSKLMIFQISNILQSDSVNYFFNEIDRISRPNYIPSHKDILHCRKATKGVYEFTIKIKVSKIAI